MCLEVQVSGESTRPKSDDYQSGLVNLSVRLVKLLMKLNSLQHCHVTNFIV